MEYAGAGDEAAGDGVPDESAHFLGVAYSSAPDAVCVASGGDDAECSSASGV